MQSSDTVPQHVDMPKLTLETWSTCMTLACYRLLINEKPVLSMQRRGSRPRQGSWRQSTRTGGPARGAGSKQPRRCGVQFWTWREPRNPNTVGQRRIIHAPRLMSFPQESQVSTASIQHNHCVHCVLLQPGNCWHWFLGSQHEHDYGIHPASLRSLSTLTSLHWYTW